MEVFRLAEKINNSWKPVRKCNKCGDKHEPPTWKHCQNDQCMSLQPDKSRSVSHPASILSQVLILGSQSPPQPRVPSNGSPVEALPVGAAGKSVQESMDILVNTVSSMAHTMKAMQWEISEMQAEKVNSPGSTFRTCQF